MPHGHVLGQAVAISGEERRNGPLKNGLIDMAWPPAIAANQFARGVSAVRCSSGLAGC